MRWVRVLIFTLMVIQPIESRTDAQTRDLERLPPLPFIGLQSSNTNTQSPALQGRHLLYEMQPASYTQTIPPVPSTPVQKRLSLLDVRRSSQLVPKQSSWVFSADYLNYKLRRSDQDYAMTSAANGSITIDGAEIHELQNEREDGFRLFFGKEVDQDWTIGVGYSTFATGAERSTQRPGSGVLYAVRSHPVDRRFAQLATAASNYDHRNLDFEFRRSVKDSSTAGVDIYGSLRWSEIGQMFKVNYSGIDFPVAPSGFDVVSEVDTRAFGIRMGAEGQWELPKDLYVFWNGETTLMYGKTTHALTETDTVDAQTSFEHVLPALGAGAGIGYHPNNGFELRIGYELNAWFNLGDRILFSDDEHMGIYSHSREDILMDGFYLRCKWSF